MSLSLFPRFGTFFDEFDAFGYGGPSVHVRESDDVLVLELEVPRYRAEELKVEVQGSHLVITGNHATSQDHYTYNQFLYGDAPMSHFRRSVYVPPTWDLSKFASELNFGVLQIRIPKAPTPPPPAPPTPLSITGAAPATSGALAPVTNKDGMQIISTSTPSEHNAVATMKWPPKVKVDDANDHITYTAALPPAVDKDHIELSLDGRNLHMGIHHERDVVKKDAQGNVVYNQSQKVSYSTNLLVPEGTVASDISTNLANGELTINVSKHANPQQQVTVKPSQ